MRWSPQALRLLALAALLGITLLLFINGSPWAAFWFSSLAWAIFLLGTMRPSCAWFGPVITHLPSEHIFITIDDGPDPSSTPRLLELLTRHQARATFFLIGQRALKHPDLVQAIRAAGHEIGNHSHTHPSAWFWALGPWRMEREITGCQQALDGTPVHFRSPVGHTNPFVQPILAQYNLHRVAWTTRGYDAIRRDVPAILQQLTKDLRPGHIILIHDATPIATQVLSGLLEHLQQNQFTTANLPRP
jgi:peptidoglycan-N-acetylglucosamine deacetylase